MRQKKSLHTSTSEARNKDSRCSQYMPDPHTTHRVAPELENLQPDHKVGHHNLRGFHGGSENYQIIPVPLNCCFEKETHWKEFL